MSPWAIHAHCLNLKVCHPNQCVTEVDFGILQVWVHVHGLSLGMLNIDNAKHVANSIGKCFELETETDMQSRGYIRMKTKVRVNEPLTPGF